MLGEGGGEGGEHYLSSNENAAQVFSLQKTAKQVGVFYSSLFVLRVGLKFEFYKDLKKIITLLKG